jgi:phosphatidylglycerophosphatase A
MRKIVLTIATAGGVGLIPTAPGSFGALVGVALWVAIAALSLPAAAGAWALLLALSIWASGRAQQALGEDDGRIVIDEVAGQLTALMFLPVRLDVGLVGFALFRLFDIWKPAPIRIFESLPGGAGVVADDIAAGVAANCVGQVLWRLVLPELTS